MNYSLPICSKPAIIGGSARCLRRALPLLLSFLSLTLLSLTACSKPSLLDEHSERSAAWLENHVGALHHTAAERLLTRITLRLSEATTLPEVLRAVGSPVVTKPWQVTILRSPEPNAYSVGGGYLAVTRGLITHLHSEAELAAVLSHEMAHDLLGHQQDAYHRSVQTAHPVVSYHIEEEISADRLGALLLERAGYEPTAALSALTLFYRSPQERVSQERVLEVETRTAALQTVLAHAPRTGPTTKNTREFIRVQRELSARSFFEPQTSSNSDLSAAVHQRTVKN